MSEVQLSPESVKALEQQSVRQKLAEMEQVSRLSVNALNLLCSNDITIPSAYAKPVAEIQTWLEAIHSGVQPQIQTLKALLPQEAPKDSTTAQPEAKDSKIDVVG